MADEIAIIKHRDIQVNARRIVVPSGSAIVASYNWSTTSTSGNPRIIAPGGSPVYVSPGLRSEIPRFMPRSPRAKQATRAWQSARGFTLDKELGDTVFDGYEPLFRSLDVCSPGFDMDTVDIVTDRDNLRKLLRFCDGPGNRGTSYIRPMDYRNEPFKFFVHGVGENRKGGPTLVFTAAATGQEVYFPSYNTSFRKKLTKMDSRSPRDTGRFSAVAKMALDGVALLVRIDVDARAPIPTCGSPTAAATGGDAEVDLSGPLLTVQASSGGQDETKAVDAPSLLLRKHTVRVYVQSKAADTPASTAKGQPSAFSKDVAKRPSLVCTKSGELLGDTPRLLELRTKNERYSDEIYWKDFYWQMLLGCAHKLVLGLHRRGTFHRMQVLSLKEVKDRAERDGPSSMIYLANTLREVIKAVHHHMVAFASSPSGKGGEVIPAAIVVEHTPTFPRAEGTLRVRLAVPGEGCLAP